MPAYFTQTATATSTSQAGPSRSAAMQEWNEFDGIGEEDEVDFDSFKESSRDHVLFCIDGSSAMQTPLDDYDPSAATLPQGSSSKPSQIHLRTAGKGKSPLHIALETVLAVERAKVLTGPSDCVGVLVYNVDSSKAPVIQLPSSLGGTLLENFREGTVLYQPMRQISAEEIKRIKDFVEEANEELAKQSSKLAAGEQRSQPSTLSHQFPPLPVDSPIDMADVFECCNHVFRDLGKTIVGAKRVLLITNNDRPELELSQTDRDLRVDPREPARTRFRDLASFGVSVLPFFIPQPGKAFDDERYWNDVLDRPDPEEGEEDDSQGDATNLHRNNKAIAADGLDKLQSLMEERLLRSGTKRALFRVPLRFGGGIEIGVTGYSLIASVQRPTYKYYDMSRRQPEEVKVKTSFTSAVTGAALEPGQIGFAYSFGKSDVPTSLQDNYWADDSKKAAGAAADESEEEEEEEQQQDGAPGGGGSKGVGKSSAAKSASTTIRTRITFTESEIRQFKTLDLEPQIKVLGFQDPSWLRFEHNVKHSVFVYPDESAFTGSTRTFAALLAVCAKRNRHAVALALLRRNATPIYCCLIPQPETYGEDGSQDKPPGFHLIPLPFADDIRDRPDKIDPTFAKCNEEQKMAMTEVTKKLRLRGSGYQAQSYPNPALQFFYAKLQSLAFAEDSFDPNQTEDKTLPQVDKMHQIGGATMKRFNDLIMLDDRVGRTVQRGVKREPEVQVDAAYVEGYFAHGKEAKLKVAELKSYAAKSKISLDPKARKDELIEEIRPHIAKILEDRRPEKKPKIH